MAILKHFPFFFLKKKNYDFTLISVTIKKEKKNEIITSIS